VILSTIWMFQICVTRDFKKEYEQIRVKKNQSFQRASDNIFKKRPFGV